jgi:UTP--glucose-1-phosphate uridylyltransferase
LTDALKSLLESQDIYGYQFSGKRYDIGNKIGFIEATIEFALQRPDLKDEIQTLINRLATK